MYFDIFFSISQTPVNDFVPSEQQMFLNFFEQLVAADDLGYETAWIAESHFSSQSQKKHKQPVIPFWEGEVGLNADIFQLSHLAFSKTKRIEMGSAVMNIVCNGGPIAAAEKLATFCTLHGLKAEESRRIHLGFSAGRFEFMNRISGVVPHSELEAMAWPVLKGKIFREACEIFLRLCNGEELTSEDLKPLTLKQNDFRTKEEWEKVEPLLSQYPLPKTWWTFEATRIVPADWRRELFVPIIGSHDPRLQIEVNEWRPVRVFNLSITKPEVIEATHERMTQHFHADGGPWKREYMPRTVFVFINEEKGLTKEQKIKRANEEAQAALSAYWKAIEGTLDPLKIANASSNALIGDAEEIAEQILERFHKDDRLMLWFDFFNHDSARVIRNMDAFSQKVIPMLKKELHYA